MVALARDSGVLAKSGKIFQCAELAKEYGYVDRDGREKPGLLPSGLVDKGLPMLRMRKPRKPKATKSAL